MKQKGILRIKHDFCMSPSLSILRTSSMQTSASVTKFQKQSSFSERERVIVRPSVCLSSVTFVHPTQATEIFGNVSTSFGTSAICDLSIKILWRSSQGNPAGGAGGGVKPKKGSQI